MTDLIQQLWTILIQFLHSIEFFFEPFLQNLDPSLFQSVIIGFLMILIFVGEQIFSEVKTQKGRGEFSKMVIFYEILNIVYIPVFATFALIFFAFFKDDLNSHSVNLDFKILTLLFLFIFVFIFLRPIFKFQQFFRGKRHKLEISFLKHLSFSKILKFRNKTKSEKMIRAWNSFWSEKSEFNERDFTKIFISHIDNAIKYKELELAIQLSQTYVSNIEKRGRSSVGYEILPKIFEWNEALWDEQQLWLKCYHTEKRIQSLFLQKHLPTFSAWALKMYKKINSRRDNFWNWHYFRNDFFQAIIKTLLKDEHCPYQLFESFRKHIEDYDKKLGKDKISDENKKYFNCIKGFFASFCPTFFSKINDAPLNYEIWEHYFPPEWKISMANIKNRMPAIILHEFLQWSRERIFKNDKEADFDKSLIEVINGIFPNIDSSFFTAFLMLFSSGEIKYALEKEPNFYILGTSMSWTGSVEEGKEDMDKRFAETMNAKAESQKEETINIILNFFSHYWDKLRITLNDDNKNAWGNANSKERKSMLKIARKGKLEKMKTEIESAKIKEMCKGDERKELYRKKFLELIESLLKEIKK